LVAKHFLLPSDGKKEGSLAQLSAQDLRGARRNSARANDGAEKPAFSAESPNFGAEVSALVSWWRLAALSARGVSGFSRVASDCCDGCCEKKPDTPMEFL